MIEWIYFLYCIVLKRSEDEFWRANPIKIIWILEQYASFYSLEENQQDGYNIIETQDLDMVLL